MSISKNKTQTQKVLLVTQIGVLSAIITVMTFIPYLGYISYGGLSITLLHIPVIIGAIVLGPYYGALLGGVWGITCIIKAIFAPPSPIEGIIFRNPIIALIPRVLVGLVAGLVFSALAKNEQTGKIQNKTITAALSTFLTMGAFIGILYLLNRFLIKMDILSGNRFIVFLFSMLILEIIVFVFYIELQKTRTTPNAGIASIVATVTNTILVMGGIYLFYSKDIGISTISFGGLTNFILTAFGINAFLEILVGYVLVVPICLALRKVNTKVE